MTKKIIIGITGSVAAFKAVQLVSDLVKQDYHIEVLMSESATKMVTPQSIQALTKRKVYIDTFDDDPAMITHIDIVKEADLFLVVPATAHTIAKLAYGMADNMLTSAFLAATCPLLIAPAMNVNMLENPLTQSNIQRLKDCGVHFVEPACGLLACGDVGKGKLADLNDIMDMIHFSLSPKLLRGKKVLVSAGPTQESLDPVRYMTNHSSGKMGYEIAKAAFCLGADVTLISGPTTLQKPYGISTFDVVTAQEMDLAMQQHLPDQNYIIMAAAVGDYSFEHVSHEKIKKTDLPQSLSLTLNKDILKGIGQKKTDKQVLCGFAMETSHLITHAQKKRLDKKCDIIVANSLVQAGAGFQGDTNIVTIITDDEVINYDLLSKQEIAYEILKIMKKMEASYVTRH